MLRWTIQVVPCNWRGEELSIQTAPGQVVTRRTPILRNSPPNKPKLESHHAKPERNCLYPAESTGLLSSEIVKFRTRVLVLIPRVVCRAKVHLDSASHFAVKPKRMHLVLLRPCEPSQRRIIPVRPGTTVATQMLHVETIDKDGGSSMQMLSES